MLELFYADTLKLTRCILFHEQITYKAFDSHILNTYHSNYENVVFFNATILEILGVTGTTK